MFKNLPRQTFGRVQSRLFPLYFALTTLCTLLQLGTLTVLSRGGALPRAPAIQLAVGVVAGLANWLVVEPHTTGIMFERYALENADGPRDSGEESGETRDGGWRCSLPLGCRARSRQPVFFPLSTHKSLIQHSSSTLTQLKHSRIAQALQAQPWHSCTAHTCTMKLVLSGPVS